MKAPEQDYPGDQLGSRVAQAFVRSFGGPSQGVFFAPGRVNLLGAHLDYNGGDVLPVAIDLGVYAAVRLRDDGRLRLASLDREGVVEVDGAQLLDRPDDLGAGAWAAYPLGVWSEFVRRTGTRVGIDVVFAGDLPIASGLSSSAAVEIAFGTALDVSCGTGLGAEAVAEIGHAAETGFVGVPCGIMDQYASALAAGGALLLHCADRTWERLALPVGGVEVLVVDTLKPRELAAERGFEDRVRECSRARDVLASAGTARGVLAAYGTDEVEAAREELGPVLFKRARHVTTEMQRMRRGVEALRAGDLRGLGAEVFASHASVREDYEVSCDELDAIVETVREIDGVFGARLTGAGFGGCVVVLLHPTARADVQARVRDAYTRRFGTQPGFHALRPGPAPGPVDVDLQD